MCKAIQVSQLDVTAPPSGFERRKTSIELGILILSITYGYSWWLNPDIPVDASYCVNKGDDVPCHRPDLIAYKVTSAMCMTYMGVMGLYNWHFSKPVKELSKRTSLPEDRLFGALESAERLNVAILCYQIWDFCVSLTIPEHLDVVFLIHHVLAALTAYFSLENGMVPYYAVFFAGCSEFSSIFLVFADMDQYFPPTSGSTYELFILLSKALFAFTFTFYRVVGWWMVSLPLWSDSLHVLNSGIAETKRPGKSSFLYVFLALNVLLGVLQLFWFSKIVDAILQL